MELHEGGFNSLWCVCRVLFLGGGGDQHPASGSVSQRETRHRAEEETRPQPAQRIKAEHQQELARRTDLQRVRITQTGSLKRNMRRKYTSRFFNYNIIIISLTVI